ncbi:diaminopropionate ammonia-lyase [Pseudonocardia eucalypti]|uniref:Diaminopropionate ammonia-lyase n=1 Tax=Pseudonocardia eucalypti TaxID=648755 RepID=A0ABP9RF65_9PSEU|nr:diaminopropionate ammonia-lyase [Pseudonocardia eucalypti]
MQTQTTAPSWYRHPDARAWRTDPVGGDVLAFHLGLPGYRRTELVELPALAGELGVARVFVKDESARLGLPAFKILGASYAISRALSERLGQGAAALGFAELAARGGPTLVAATDGNHGRAVAHVARLLGLGARIFLPATLSRAAVDAVAGEGATVVELPLPYDDVVDAAASWAREAGSDALLVQDTAWPGYERVPAWIVDGYATLFAEADAQLASHGVAGVDLVAVPMGVGSLAQACVRHYRSGGSTGPVVLGVEARNAPAVISSLHAGEPISVPTEPTIMAGLNCGTPSANAWPYLAAGMDAAVTVTEAQATSAVHDLTALGVDAGPCGAAALAGVRAVAQDPPRRAATALTPNAVVLLLSTESTTANPLPT